MQNAYGLSIKWEIKPDFKQIFAAFVLAWRGFKFLGWSHLFPLHIHAHFTTHLLREKAMNKRVCDRCGGAPQVGGG